MREGLLTKINLKYYDVSYSKAIGALAVEWKRCERALNWSRWSYTLNAMAAIPGARHMSLSRTSMLSKWSVDGCIERSARWAQRRSFWIYGTRNTVALRPDKPVLGKADLRRLQQGSSSVIPTENGDESGDAFRGSKQRKKN